MTVFTESRHPGEFILSEANRMRSRENVTLASGEVVAAGQVLGIVTATGEYAPYDNAASDGTQVAKAIAIYDTDASDAAAEIAVIARDAEVNGETLTYLTDADEDAAVTDLATVGIIVR